MGNYLLSHAPILRKHLEDELGLHGTKASLSIDRWSGDVIVVTSDQEKQLVENVPDCAFGNRFSKWVFPSLAPIVSGSGGAAGHPDLEDGWIAQRFTDAALQSVQGGRWVKV